MSAVGFNYTSPISCFNCDSIRDTFDCSDDTLDKIKKIALGAIVFIASIPVLKLIERGVEALLDKFKIVLTEEQEVIQVWRSLGNMPMIGVVLQVALLAYIVILGPILEEYIFRDLLYCESGQSDTFCTQVFRVVSNGFLFGLCHLSPYQGWTNLPIFAITFVLGCIFAILREISGDIIAPTIAHILNNGVVMFFFLT